MEKEKNESCLLPHDMNIHDMSCHEKGHDTCHDNTITCNHDMSNFDKKNEMLTNSQQLNKSDWWYLVNQLTEWRVFAPRSVIKKNPLLAWKIMNLCKDDSVRIKGAYFTTCFKRELLKIEQAEKIEQMKSWARQKLGIAACT